MYITAIIPAAGMGSRMNMSKNKLYINLDGKPVLYHTLKKFINNSFIEQVLVVLQEGEIKHFQNSILNLLGGKKNKIKTVVGGKTRKESVFNGLKAASDKADYI